MKTRLPDTCGAGIVLQEKSRNIKKIGEIETRHIIITISKNGKENLRQKMDTVINKFENRDCMEGMKEYPDGYFNLAVVDPPYGIGMSGGNVGYKGFNNLERKDWDNVKPSPKYWKLLFKKSKNQIVWGGNYFALPGSRCFVVWDKGEGFKNRTYAEAEIAWTSFDRNIKIFKHDPLAKGDYHGKIHPTQKPVALYLWLLNNYAKQGDLILDTHVGSASSLIACEKMGFNYVGYELDEDYYRDAQKRLAEFRMQTNLFDEPKEEIKPDQFRLNL